MLIKPIDEFIKLISELEKISQNSNHSIISNTYEYLKSVQNSHLLPLTNFELLKLLSSYFTDLTITINFLASLKYIDLTNFLANLIIIKKENNLTHIALNILNNPFINLPISTNQNIITTIYPTNIFPYPQIDYTTSNTYNLTISASSSFIYNSLNLENHTYKRILYISSYNLNPEHYMAFSKPLIASISTNRDLVFSYFLNDLKSLNTNQTYEINSIPSILPQVQIFDLNDYYTYKTDGQFLSNLNYLEINDAHYLIITHFVNQMIIAQKIIITPEYYEYLTKTNPNFSLKRK